MFVKRLDFPHGPHDRFTKRAVESIVTQLKNGWFDQDGHWRKGQMPLDSSGVRVEAVDIVENEKHYTLRTLLADESEVLSILPKAEEHLTNG